MSEEAFIAYLLVLVVGAVLIEALILAARRSAHWQPREGVTNLLLGITNLVVGVLFTAVNLSVYTYLYEHFSLGLSFDGFAANLLFAVLVYDLLYWINHWAHHRLSILWCNHLVHHSGRSFNLTTAVRIGWLGNFTVWLFFLPMAMLGIALEYYLLVVAAQLIYQFFIHSSMIPELGVLEKVLVTPSQHRVHHASNPQYLDKNFGCFLVIWDRLFGTYQAELKHLPVSYGITTPIIHEHATGYLNTFLYLPYLRTAFAQVGWRAKWRVLLGGPERVELADNAERTAFATRASHGHWVGFIPPTLLGFYLAMQYPALPTSSAVITAAVFLLAANAAGLQHRSARAHGAFNAAVAIAQIAVSGLLLLESSEHAYLLLAVASSAAGALIHPLLQRNSPRAEHTPT
ncbi:sterol desaturase family protein [Pseudomonas cremoricolorata]|uniref:sterol desaturase family protein n=1 Tax=Pseudomonas cremoricolorata TaxID=157783 RepID=UPI000676AF80|nr:sterol desaturase family protein [Pseudomonas cremoricolorata]